jgi:hypothetical protein
MSHQYLFLKCLRTGTCTDGSFQYPFLEMSKEGHFCLWLLSWQYPILELFLRGLIQVPNNRCFLWLKSFAIWFINGRKLYSVFQISVVALYIHVAACMNRICDDNFCRFAISAKFHKNRTVTENTWYKVYQCISLCTYIYMLMEVWISIYR